MQSESLLTPRRTRDDVLDLMRRMIAGRELAPGARLEEVELSRRIGVSRTPVREALIALEMEGWVRSVPNKGVSVCPADERMVCELYPILGALEAAAMRLAGPWSAGAIHELRGLNTRLAGETRRERQYQLDAAFHRRLVRDCGNARLLALIETHWAQAGRYDGAATRGTANRDGSCREHAAIIDALEADDLDRASLLITGHWARGVEVVRAWLRANP
jgi:DNA-binding GntR family transcriptional regulator